MTAPLPSELRPLVLANPSDVVRLVDPDTNRTYLLVPSEVYARLQPILNGDDPRTWYPAVDRVMAEDDAADPLLASYQTITRSDSP